MAQQKIENRALSLRAVLVLIFIFLLSGAGSYFVYDFYQGPPQPWYAKWQIKRYLKKQTGQSTFTPKLNLNLDQDVAKLEARLAELDSALADYETNSARLRAQILQLNRALNNLAEIQRRRAILTNRWQEFNSALERVPAALTNLAHNTLTNLDAMQKQLADLKVVVDPVLAPLQPLREEIDSLQKQVDEKLQARAKAQRELAGLELQLQSGKRQQGTNLLDLTAEDLGTISNQVATLKGQLEALAGEIKPLQEQLNQKQQEYDRQLAPVAAQYRTLRWLGQRFSNLGVLQTNLQRLQLDISTAEQDLAGRLKDLGVPADSEAIKKAIAERQNALAEMDKKHQQQIADRANLRKELWNQKSLLAAQQADLSAQFRQRILQAKLYREMYEALGEQLAVVEQLLSRADTNQQKAGLQMAMQAAYYCSAPNMIENYWLTARIGEAYLLPNRHLANDPSRKPPLTPDTVVQQCIAAYRNANEPENIIRLLKESLAATKTLKEADQARLVLAQEYEQNSRYSDALAMYRAISDKNRWVSNKIAAMERRVK